MNKNLLWSYTPTKMVCWISIIVIHIFIILKPKDAKLIMIVQLICGSAILGHIGVKSMKKIHADGLLESLDYESLDACESCLMGKMTKTPFSGIMQRATDL